jgi:hypothetical protein
LRAITRLAACPVYTSPSLAADAPTPIAIGSRERLLKASMGAENLDPGDCDSSLAIVQATHGFVDLFKIGRVNYLPMTRTTDWRDYTLRMVDLCQQLGAAHYIKKDLQSYLPAGYHNPRRVAQHH